MVFDLGALTKRRETPRVLHTLSGTSADRLGMQCRLNFGEVGYAVLAGQSEAWLRIRAIVP